LKLGEKDNLEKEIYKEINKAKLSPHEIEKVLKNFKQINPQKYTTKKIDIPDRHIKFGVFSDAHMGHSCYRPDILRKLIKDGKKQKVEFWLNCGDTLEGMSGRDGHIYELNQIGASQQLNYFKDEFKHFDKDVFSIEAQNSHGGWFKSKGNMGLNIGEELDKRAKHYKFIGYDEQDIELDNGAKIRLRHPGGGTAYAISYKLQKYIEAISGGKKPHLLFNGHFHKALYMFYRNVHGFECFDGRTKIKTSKGKKEIRKIVEGDFVLTHNNRFKKVTKTMNRWCDGNFVKIFFRNEDEYSNVLNATPEHPVLVIRNKIKKWIKIKDIVVGDKILINYNKCKYCGKHIPYWRKTCTECINNRKRNMQLKSMEKYRNKSKNGNKHFKEDIIPFSKKLEKMGFKVFPIGNILPDIIAFKDGKLFAYEIENQWISNGKEAKYDNNTFFDEIKWEIINRGDKDFYFRNYEVDEETGFVIIDVLRIKHFKKRSTKVYNISVEEDESYIASGVVVHNCGTLQEQSPFMKKTNTPAHLGYWIIDVNTHKNKSKGIERIASQFVPFYE
jgi:hypothetical protein